MAERYKFRSQAQRPDALIDAYLTSLKELAKSCDFGALEEEMIRDQIMEKFHSRTLKQKLLQQESLDLSKTVKIMWSEEIASQEALHPSSGTKENQSQINCLAHESTAPQKL